MLTFHIKADMSVRSLTGGLNIGDGFEDIVVISDMEYALITMKMISPSGEAIPDVQFTPILEEGKTIWKAILPNGAISSGGLLTYQFFITTASGKMYKTERGNIRVLDSVNNYVPDTVAGLSNYTLSQYRELLAAIQTLANSNQEGLKGIITNKYVVVDKDDWESKYERVIVDSDETITNGLVMLVVPANEMTRELASNMRIRVKLTQDAESKLHSLVITRSEEEPLSDISLFFNVLYIRRDTEIGPAAVLVGTDTVPADVDATVRELRNVLSTKIVTLSKDSWSTNNQSVYVENISDGDIVFLVPMDDDVRKAASMARLNTNDLGQAGRNNLISYKSPSADLGLISVWKPSSIPAPTIDLAFDVVTIRGFGEEHARAYILGVDPLAGEIADEVSALKDTLTNFSTSVGTVISNLREEITVSQTVALKSSYQAAAGLLNISVLNVDNGDIILLAPADRDTKEEIARLGLSPTIDVKGSKGDTVTLNADVKDAALEHDLTFVVIRFKEDNSKMPPKVALIGASATPQDVRNALNKLEEKVSVGTVSLAVGKGTTEATIERSPTLDNGDILFLYPGMNIDYRLVKKHKISVKLNNSNQLVFSLKNPPTDIITILFNFVRLNDDTRNAPVASIVGAPYFEETPTNINLSRLDDGEVVETFADGSTKTTTIEYDVDGNPVKITDGDGNITVLAW